MAPSTVRWTAKADAKYLRHALSQQGIETTGDSKTLYERMSEHKKTHNIKFPTLAQTMSAVDSQNMGASGSNKISAGGSKHMSATNKAQDEDLDNEEVLDLKMEPNTDTKDTDAPVAPTQTELDEIPDFTEIAYQASLKAKATTSLAASTTPVEHEDPATPSQRKNSTVPPPPAPRPSGAATSTVPRSTLPVAPNSAIVITIHGMHVLNIANLDDNALWSQILGFVHTWVIYIKVGDELKFDHVNKSGEVRVVPARAYLEQLIKFFHQYPRPVGRPSAHAICPPIASGLVAIGRAFIARLRVRIDEGAKWEKDCYWEMPSFLCGRMRLLMDGFRQTMMAAKKMTLKASMVKVSPAERARMDAALTEIFSGAAEYER